MEDLISRKAAVEAIEKTDWYHINKDGVLVRGANSAEDLPLFIAEDVFEALRVVAPAKQQWIPVAEQLPETEKIVLAYTGVGYFSETAQWTGYRWEKTWDFEVLYGVTHWMPLPEPPKEG